MEAGWGLAHLCAPSWLTCVLPASPQVRVRFELKSPVKTIEDFLRKFSPSRLTSGCPSISNLATAKATHRSGPSSLSTETTLLGLEDRLGQPAPAIASNGYSGGAAGWAQDPDPDPDPDLEQELRYEAESPDEAALVHAARAYNCALAARLHDQVSVELPHLGRLTFELLHTLGFDSARQRMSVVVRHPLSDEICVYTKGADSAVMDLLLPCAPGRPRPRRRSQPRPLPAKHAPGALLPRPPRRSGLQGAISGASVPGHPDSGLGDRRCGQHPGIQTDAKVHVSMLGKVPSHPAFPRFSPFVELPQAQWGPPARA